MASNWRLSVEEIEYVLLTSLLLGAAFTAFMGELTVRSGAFYSVTGLAIVLTRELGQRIVAQLAHGYVELKMSVEGSAMTIFGAALSVVTQLPLIILFPVFNEYDNHRWESWGLTTDAMWMKRKFWIVSGGTLALFLGWILSGALGLEKVSEGFIIFLIFQLLPLDYSKIPTGALDGAYILRWSGYIWLVLFGSAMLGLALTL